MTDHRTNFHKCIFVQFFIEIEIMKNSFSGTLGLLQMTINIVCDRHETSCPRYNGTEFRTFVPFGCHPFQHLTCTQYNDVIFEYTDIFSTARKHIWLKGIGDGQLLLILAKTNLYINILSIILID